MLKDNFVFFCSLIMLGLFNESFPQSYQHEAIYHDSCVELQVSQKYTKLCNTQFHVYDSSINISIKSKFILDDKFKTYYLVFYYSVDNRMPFDTNEEGKKAGSLLYQLNSYKLVINSEYFSGNLNLAIPFVIHKEGAGSSYTGYHIMKIKYLNGQVLENKILWDVNLDTELQIMRPN